MLKKKPQGYFGELKIDKVCSTFALKRATDVRKVYSFSCLLGKGEKLD